ncbi:hypothetical protein GCM10020256_47550 [Streptomyces thermocoprophilus]
MGESAPAQKGPLTPMQIRLTVVDPLAPAGVRGRAASCDVLVTAPAGTALAAVASGLAAAVQAGDGPVVLYAGAERLDAQRCTLGEPPLTDGAVLSLGSPALPEPHPELDDAPAQLHVVAGPDAGGVHLLHGGEVRVGRSADADVPLDDPDVSRLHCAVTLAADGRVTVADLGSTNGTVLDGTRVDGRPVRVGAGSLLRIGESALRLAPPGGPGGRIPTTPDGEGHVRVPCGAEAGGRGRRGSRGPRARGGRGGRRSDGADGSGGTVRTGGPDGADCPRPWRRLLVRRPARPCAADDGARAGGGARHRRCRAGHGPPGVGHPGRGPGVRRAPSRRRLRPGHARRGAPAARGGAERAGRRHGRQGPGRRRVRHGRRRPGHGPQRVRYDRSGAPRARCPARRGHPPRGPRRRTGPRRSWRRTGRCRSRRRAGP